MRVRRTLSGNVTLSLLPLGIYVGLEKAVHEVTLIQMNGRERQSGSEGEYKHCVPKNMDSGEKLQKENSKITTK